MLMKIEQVKPKTRREIKAAYEGLTPGNEGNGISFLEISEKFRIERTAVSAIAREDQWLIRKQGLRLVNGQFVTPNGHTVERDRAVEVKRVPAPAAKPAVDPIASTPKKVAAKKQTVATSSVFVVPANMPDELRKKIAIACVESSFPVQF